MGKVLVRETGKENIYVRISNPGSQRKPNSELSSKGLNLRVRLSGTPLVQVQYGNIYGDELLPLLFRMIRKNEGVFWKLIEMGKYSLSKMLTVSQLVDVLLNLPMATIRRMRTLFLNFGFIIFLSEEKMRSEMSKRVQHLEEADMKFEKIFLYPVGGEYGLTEIDLLYSGDLVKYMEGVYDKLESDYYDNPDSTIKINLSGDKGGKSMKFHFEICHPSSSVFYIHLFCMYEGTDCLENMTKVLGKFVGAFQAIADPGFKLRGRKVEFFLGGDFKFLDGVIGTQGSSAKMPCSKCKVGLDHMKNHGGAKHGQEFCQFPFRTIDEMEGHYNANLADDRGNKGPIDLCSTGKHHESIKGRNLFRFIPLDNVVPPILHITLGTVLRLFNKLLDHCRSLDGFENTSEFQNSESQWMERSLEMEEQEAVVRELGTLQVDLHNFGERLGGREGGGGMKLTF